MSEYTKNAAREWLLQLVDAGCFLDDPEDLEDSILRMSERGLRRAIDRHYSGGFAAFELVCVNEELSDARWVSVA